MTLAVTIASPETGPSAPVPETPVGADQSATPNAPSGDRPAWLPEKFSSAEDLAKAYGELERRLGGGQPDPAQTPQAKPEAKPETKSGEQPEEKPQAPQPFQFERFSQEFAQHGKLSDESYTALSALGLPKEVVDTYIEGQRAVGERMFNEVAETVGGRDAYSSMVQWAAANLSRPEIEAYNAATAKGGEAAKLAAQGLFSKFSASNGVEPKLIQGSSGARSATDVFRSRAEMVAAMQDARYTKDPAYRNDVMQKALRSEF